MHVHQELESFYLGAVDALPVSPGFAQMPEQGIGYRVQGIVAKPYTQNPLPSTLDPKPVEPTSRRAKKVLLILEDFDEIRASLAKQKQRYDIFSCAKLRDALILAREQSPSLLLINSNFRDENTYRAIEQLRAVLPTSIIVLMGGPDTVKAQEQALRAGASKVIDKTCDYSAMDINADRQTIFN